MPVRWPRRPAAVSEAVVADAEPDLSCAGELEQPLKALIGEVRSLSRSSVCVSVGLSVKYVVVRLISLLGLCLLGSSVRAGLWVSLVPERGFLCVS